MKYKEILQALINKGITEQDAKSILNWYQIAGFLIPSNVLSLVLTLLGIEVVGSLYLIVALLCMLLATNYVQKNVDNAEQLKSRVKILKPICIIILILWVISVIANIILLANL